MFSVRLLSTKAKEARVNVVVNLQKKRKGTNQNVGEGVLRRQGTYGERSFLMSKIRVKKKILLVSQTRRTKMRR